MSALAEVAASPGAVPADVVSRLASIDPADAAWREAAATLAGARTADARRQASLSAMEQLAARARGRLSAPLSGLPGLSSGALQGWWAEESRRGASR
ncbi:MAG: hypothetical protein R2712_07180 [Vicinamibacterales bacterium]